MPISDSGPVFLPPQTNETESTITLDLTPLNLRVQDYFTWSIEFSGVTEGDQVGLKVLAIKAPLSTI